MASVAAVDPTVAEAYALDLLVVGADPGTLVALGLNMATKTRLETLDARVSDSRRWQPAGISCSSRMAATT